MPKIVVELPKDRKKYGTLSIFDDNNKSLAGPFRALGKADNQHAKDVGNPTRNPIEENGDTPTGFYKTLELRTDKQKKFGPHGRIPLDPTSGQAWEAQVKGRKYLAIHGGHPAKNGKDLRPTEGCIRVSDEDMKQIVDIYQNPKYKGTWNVEVKPSKEKERTENTLGDDYGQDSDSHKEIASSDNNTEVTSEDDGDDASLEGNYGQDDPEPSEVADSKGDSNDSSDSSNSSDSRSA